MPFALRADALAFRSIILTTSEACVRQATSHAGLPHDQVTRRPGS